MKDILFKTLKSTPLPAVLRNYKKRKNLVTILCLHRIHETPSAVFPHLTPAEFERLLMYINKYYEVTTIGNIEKLSGKKPGLVFSFDDGFFDTYKNAFPLLEKFGFACNLNVVTKCLDNNHQIWTQRINNIFDEIRTRQYLCTIQVADKTIVIDNFTSKNIFYKALQVFIFLFSKDENFVKNYLNDLETSMPFPIPSTRMMNWEELIIALGKYDIELGSHSCSHYTMSNIKDEAVLHDEIFLSKKIIEKHTGRQVDIFAFPNGSYNETILGQCQNAGYRHILTVGEKLLPQKDYNAFIMPRVLISYSSYAENFLKVENFHNFAKGILAKIKR
jgi:peptidoglycan/xylan/chitin deacetylase (PgdA/CDA1 family)